MHDKTMTFSLGTDREGDIKRVLTIVYDALREKGYNPINQWWVIFYLRIRLILRHTTTLAVLSAGLTVTSFCRCS